MSSGKEVPINNNPDTIISNDDTDTKKDDEKAKAKPKFNV